MFPLSTWAEKQRPLEEWLVDELDRWYDVPRKIGQAWVKDDQLLPLLDGLDEVKPEYRTACIEAIEDFQHNHGLLPLAICSRVADYEALGKQLRLQGAVLIQPLKRQQVDAFLAQGGDSLIALRQALHNDAKLWELLDTPLMLYIAILAFMGKSVAALKKSGTRQARRNYLAIPFYAFGSFSCGFLIYPP